MKKTFEVISGDLAAETYEHDNLFLYLCDKKIRMAGNVVSCAKDEYDNIQVEVKKLGRIVIKDNPNLFTLLNASVGSADSEKESKTFVVVIIAFLVPIILIAWLFSGTKSEEVKNHSKALDLCDAAIKQELNHPSTFNPQYLDSSAQENSYGNTQVVRGFSAKNGMGIEIEYRAQCVVYPDGSAKVVGIEQK